MKRFIKAISIILAASLSMVGCKEHYITYDDAEYVMFADTAKVYTVRSGIMGTEEGAINSFEVSVVSTVVCDYDRNFAVEIIDSESNAVEIRDFRLESNNFVIPAGERTATIKVNGNLTNLPYDEQLYFTLRLVMPDRLVMPLYGDKTIVRINRTEKFDRSKFTGYAVVTSMFLYEFTANGRYQRLIKTSADPDDVNGVILHDFLYDGYDVKISFDDESDPSQPAILMPSDQVISDEAPVFGTVHGDNHILMENSNIGLSYFFPEKAVAVLVNRFYVENIGEEIGTVGHYLTEIDWVSDEEAARLRNEEGM